MILDLANNSISDNIMKSIRSLLFEYEVPFGSSNINVKPVIPQIFLIDNEIVLPNDNILSLRSNKIDIDYTSI